MHSASIFWYRSDHLNHAMYGQPSQPARSPGGSFVCCFWKTGEIPGYELSTRGIRQAAFSCPVDTSRPYFVHISPGQIDDLRLHDTRGAALQYRQGCCGPASRTGTSHRCCLMTVHSSGYAVTNKVVIIDVHDMYAEARASVGATSQRPASISPAGCACIRPHLPATRARSSELSDPESRTTGRLKALKI